MLLHQEATGNNDSALIPQNDRRNLDKICEKVDENTGNITQIQTDTVPSGGEVSIHVFIDQIIHYLTRFYY